MDDRSRLLVFIARVLVAVALVYATSHYILPTLGRAITAFVLTPGGIVLLVIAWRYLGRHKK